MKRILNIMSMFTLLLCTVLTVHAIFLTYYPFQIVVLQKFKTTQNTYKRGDQLEYELDFIKNHDFRATVKYFLVDGIIVRLEDGGTHRTIGKYKVFNSRTVPQTILPGTYKLRIELDYEIAPWRHALYTWESNTFQVK